VAGEISFLSNPRYASLLATTRASAVILREGASAPIPMITVENPDLAFARATRWLNGEPARPPAAIHPAAVISPGASLGKGVSIGACAVVEDGAVIGDGTMLHPQVYVGRSARIGPGCLIYPQVVIREKCEIGARAILHSGVVVGSDGFGYATDKGVHHKIPQVGIVVIGDDVEIGANVTIDRARFGRTVIGSGTKIDNLVQIGHNVVLGEHCLIVAQAGISGSTKLGHHVILGGQVGTVGHIEIGDGAIVTAKSGVSKDVPPGLMISGEMAVESRTHLKELAAIGKLPEALQEIRKLRKEIDELQKKVQG
jgi:UDP-3-O-[3-hydroxymyristoyl] glucosamine N-acyltransferase